MIWTEHNTDSSDFFNVNNIALVYGKNDTSFLIRISGGRNNSYKINYTTKKECKMKYEELKLIMAKIS